MADIRKSLMRSLGEFVGHVRVGLRTPVVGDRESGDHARRESVDEHVIDDASGQQVIVRRTVIEEVVVQRAENQP